jgi:hypothetical protein
VSVVNKLTAALAIRRLVSDLATAADKKAASNLSSAQMVGLTRLAPLSCTERFYAMLGRGEHWAQRVRGPSDDGWDGAHRTASLDTPEALVPL